MRVSDYGGHAQDRKRGNATDRKAITYSYRCLSCGHVTHFTVLQLARLKAQPRCVACGGGTEETEASFQRRTGMSKTDVPKMLGKVTEKDSRGRIRESSLGAKPFICEACGKGFRTEIGHKLHVEEGVCLKAQILKD